MEVNDYFGNAVDGIKLNVVKNRAVKIDIIFKYTVSVLKGLISKRELGQFRRKKVYEGRRHDRSIGGQKAVILQSAKKKRSYHNSIRRKKL